MEDELKTMIETTVLDILRESNVDETTEFMIRKAASEKLGMNLNVPELKMFVRRIVESFLIQENAKEKALAEEKANVEEERVDEPEEEDKEDDQDEKQNIVAAKEFDDDGDLVICKLSDKRKVTIQDFRGKTLVSIREYYQRDGKDLPTSKGISLTTDQWSAFKNNVAEIEAAIKKMESSLEQ